MKTKFREGIKHSGKVKISVYKRRHLIDQFVLKNIVLDSGLQSDTDLLCGDSRYYIFRMAIGCDGASAGDPFQPKIPEHDRTTLFWEVGRKDISSHVTGVRQVMFEASFNSLTIPDTAFKDMAKRYINEAMLIVGDGVLTPGGGLIYPPTIPDVDESPFSMRCFKSIPFDAADDITIVFDWTIYSE